MKTYNAYITLDYELFLGSKPGTPEKCLVEPMDALSEMCRKYSIPLNVFVDASYLLKLFELKDQHARMDKDYNLVSSHITRLDKEGHAINLHLHPQWIGASYNKDQWSLPPMPYKLSDLTIDNQKQLIENGVNILNSLISKRVKAFRAGGYSFENFPELRGTLKSCGVMIDTSVLRGEYVKEEYHSYDYRRVPKRTSYPISDSLTVIDMQSDMIEFPISTIVVNPLAFLINKHLKRQNANGDIPPRKFGDGCAISIPGGAWGKVKHKIGQLFTTKCLRASVEDPKNLERVLSYVKTHYEGDDFVIIGHPKNLSPRSIYIFEQFIIHHPELNFVTF